MGVTDPETTMNKNDTPRDSGLFDLSTILAEPRATFPPRWAEIVPVDPFERAKVNEWLFWEQYSHEPYIAVRRFQKAYLGKRDEELDPKLLANGRRALGQMELQLRKTAFIAGEKLTVADIALVAYTRAAPEGGFDLEEFPSVRQWIARVERGLNIGESEAA